MVRRILDFKR